jgi:hypothetical protein
MTCRTQTRRLEQAHDRPRLGPRPAAAQHATPAADLLPAEMLRPAGERAKRVRSRAARQGRERRWPRRHSADLVRAAW